MRKRAAFFVTGWGFPLLLLFFVTCAYGVNITAHGYYLDDWASIAAIEQGGEAGMIAYGVDDSRPFEAWVMAKCFALFGVTPLTWQIIAVVSRYMAALMCWLIIRELWPAQGMLNGAVAMIFGVFPFFRHQAICLAYFIILFQYFVVLLSFYLTLLALRRSNPILKGIFIVLSLLTSLFHLACIEYYLSLEAARFLLIWFALEHRERKSFWRRLWSVIPRYIPYGLIILLILGYRFLYVPTLSADVRPIAFSYSGVKLILHLLSLGTQYLSESLLGVWYRSMDLVGLDFSLYESKIGLGLGLICGTVAAVTLKGCGASDDSHEGQGEMLFLGFCAMVLGFLPGMMINVSPASANTYHDRYLIPSFWGISLFTVTALFRFMRDRRGKIGAVSFLLFISVFFHIRNGYMYRYSHERQREFQWSLYERIPDLMENTAIIGDGVTASFMGGWADGSMVFEMYGKRKGVSPTGYWYFSASDENLLPLLENGEAILKDVKMFHFSAEPTDTVIITKPEYGKCVWLLNEADRYNPYLESGIEAYIPYQNKSRILTGGAHRLSSDVFGVTPPQSWCIYFERADLALDLGENERVLDLYREALDFGFFPLNPTEMRPFIQAAARTGQMDLAREWTGQARSMDPAADEYFDHLWDLIEMEVAG